MTNGPTVGNIFIFELLDLHLVIFDMITCHLKVMGNIKYGAYSYKEGYERRDSVRKDYLKRDWNMEQC